MSTQPYTGITFDYKNFIDDIDRIRKLTVGFLTTESIRRLEDFKVRVENARKAAGATRLEIPIDCCLETVKSDEFRGSGQTRSVYGKLSFEWEITHTDRGRNRQMAFDLTGVATTGIHVIESPESIVAHWQFEIGDASSPGCHFHSSVNQRGEDGLFPKWLKIPRLPGFLLSPLDGLDFLLGELFPKRWLQRVSESSDERNGWTKSQANRMLRILQWQQEMVKNANFGTPWLSLKKAKPPISLLSER